MPDYLASDREREDVAGRLRDGAGEGRLGHEELERRLALAYSASTRSDLAALVADLPPQTPVAPRRSRPPALLTTRPNDSGSTSLTIRDTPASRLVVWATGSAILNGTWLGLAGSKALTEYDFVDWYWPSVPMVAGAVWLWCGRKRRQLSSAPVEPRRRPGVLSD